MSAAHTKTPWWIYETPGYNNSFCYIKGTKPNGEPETWGNGAVAIIPRSTIKPMQENAEFIVQACNDHAELKRRAECVDELVAKIGLWRDALDSLILATNLPIKAETHVRCLTVNINDMKFEMDAALSHVATATEQSNTRVEE